MIGSNIRRVVLRLRYEKGLTKKSIARALLISPKMVQKILREGDKK